MALETIQERRAREAIEVLAGIRKSNGGKALTEATLATVNAQIASANKDLVAAERRIAAANAELASLRSELSALQIIDPNSFAPVQHKHEIKDVTDLTEQLQALTDSISGVISTGSGVNGSYIRLRGGWQLCWITGVTFAYADADHLSYTWTYPIAFSSSVIFRSVGFPNPNVDLTGVTMQQMGQIRLGAGAASAAVRVARAQGAANFVAGNQAANCQIFAVGPWA